MSHSSHSSHSSHNNTGSHTNTGHNAVSLTWAYWPANLSAGESLQSSINRIKEIRNNIAYCQANKTPDPMPGINLANVSDTTFNTGVKAVATQYMSMKDALSTLRSAVSLSTTTPGVSAGTSMQAANINTMKAEVDTLASKSTHSNHANHSSHTSHSSSKAILKKNIKDFVQDALPIVNNTQVVSFVFKDDPEENLKVGFIADVTDELLSSKHHDKMDYYNSIGILLKAVQELSQNQQSLEQQIKELNDQNELLRLQTGVLL